jgi:hypothetical protein
VDYDDGDSGIISMAALRDIIARMPAELPIMGQEPAAAPPPTPALVLSDAEPCAAPGGKRSGKGARAVKWAPEVVEPHVGTLRRSARQEKAARALGVRSTVSLQDVRVSSAYAAQ